jgi:lactobin A/cerein 7B family class IIb bacteriocin
MAPNQTQGIRLLTDTELDAVNGGLIWFAVGFLGGLVVGACLGYAVVHYLQS